MDVFLSRLFDFLLRFMPIRIIKPHESGVITRLGKYHRTAQEGICFLLPFLHDMDIVTNPEQVIDLRAQSMTTNDRIAIAVSGAVSYRVEHAEKAIFNVQDYDRSIQALSLGIIAHYVNNHSFEECLNAEELAKQILQGIREKATNKWGLRILNVWITDLAEHKVIRIIGDPTGPIIYEEETV